MKRLTHTALTTLVVSGLFPFAFMHSATAQERSQPILTDRLIGFDPNNAGWASSPSILIICAEPPTCTDAPVPSGTPTGETAFDLVKDAILQYWSVGTDQDGLTESPATCSCAFFTSSLKNFGSSTITVATSGSANIVISFSELPVGIFGETILTTNPSTHKITSATITLTTVLTTASYSLNAANYQDISAHELGHAIGLGHSGPPGTLMYPFLNLSLGSYLPLSTSSQQTLSRLY